MTARLVMTLSLVLSLGGAALAQEERFDLRLTEVGERKIAVIKEVRSLTRLDLKASKELVDRAPVLLGLALTRAEAEAAVKTLEAAGALAEVATPAPATEEQNAKAEPGETFDLRLVSVGPKLIAVVKEVRGLTGQSLRETRDVTREAPVLLGLTLTRAEAEAGLRKLTDAGAEAELVRKGAPDPDLKFDSLVLAAFDPKTGRARGVAHLNRLWAAAYQLPQWHILLEPTSTLAEPKPVVAEVDGKRWVYAFTSTARLQAWAKKNGRGDAKGGALALSMEALEAKVWLAGLAEAGVHGVRFNDGLRGWFSPVAQLEPIRAHLEKQGLLPGKPEKDGEDE
jgi:ribosomal protein L7/L12